MSIIVLLSPIFFPSLNYHLYILNHYILNSKGDNNCLPFQKLTKVSTSNIKINVNGIFDPLKCAKILFLHNSLLFQLEMLSHVIVKREVEALRSPTLSLHHDFTSKIDWLP